MKKLVLTLSMMLLLAGFSLVSAQSPSDKLFEKYSGQEGFTTVHISQELFGLFADMELEEGDEDIEEVQDMMSQLNYIRILMYEASEGNQAELDEFRSEIKKFDLQGFSELMVVKEKGEEVRFMARKDGKMISELLLIINEENEAGFISINGNIDMKTVSKLSKTMQIDGMEHLEDLEEKEK
jgi:hypothetical protein